MKKAASILCLVSLLLALVSCVPQGEHRHTLGEDATSTTSCAPQDEHRHTLRQVAAIAATCTEAGNNAYYVCTTCRKVFSDAKGMFETSVEAQTIPAEGHLLPPTGICGLVQCENCGGTFGRTDHELNAATCTTCIFCKHCGYTEGAPLGHLWEAECDTVCGRCEETRTASHADTDNNGVCDDCNAPVSSTLPGGGGSVELPRDEF
jgi:hypothetical protein